MDMNDILETTFTLNGETVTRRVPVRQNLVDFLREAMGLTGTHIGCEHGVCGACTVRINGEIVRGCLVLAVQVEGRSVETIEGLTDSGEIADLQQAFHTRNALQCGFCTPGMLLTAQDLARKSPQASREEIREHIAGNLCRCTGYQAIVDAVESVMRKRCEAAADGNSRHD
jgi:carbon-monoxide dehydrogenase small subunit